MTTSIKNILSIVTFAAFVGLISVAGPLKSRIKPTPSGSEEGEELEARKKAYIEAIHRAAPGTDWRAIEQQNAINSYYRFHNISNKTTATYAGGLINATWFERGNDNQAGRMNSFVYFPGTSKVYAGADGGSIWMSSLPTVAWRKVSDFTEFNTASLAAIQRGGTGARVFCGAYERLWRTDNDGTTFDTSRGLSFPIAWGANRILRIFPVHDARNTIYCVTFLWEPTTWTAQFALYASTDSGLNFNFIRYFNYHNDNQLSFSTALNSSDLYALGVKSSGADTLYRITNSTVTVAGVSNAINSTDDKCDMQCMQVGGVTHFYAMTGGTNIYHSTDSGNHWRFKSSPTDGYMIGVSCAHPETVYYGGVEAFRSNDSGGTWTRVNTWGSYYGDPANKLHADLHAFSSFFTSSSAEFCLVGTDGGAYISNDRLATVSNLSLAGLHVNQMWDHITSPGDSSIIIGGAQDQGLQMTLAGAGTGTGIINSNQIISGDYGQMRFTNQGRTLWPEYPGGWIYLFNNLGTSSPNQFCSYHQLGSQLPVYGWMLPTSPYYTSDTQDEILIGGGNISGDTGSYLIKLTLTTAGTPTVTPTQYDFNFRSHSASGTAGISAIGISKLSNSLLYVATEDGTFFYSTNAGTTWDSSSGFSGVGSYYLYGSSILASADSVNKVYFAGSGYSNPPVFVSRDHGVTFTDMSAGLPPTLVNRLAAYKNDSFVFAATEAGPYVYVTARNRWYSLADAGTPAVNWKSVEYIKSINTVRFATYGRGIWDFVMPHPGNVPTVNNQTPQYTLGPNPLSAGKALTVFSQHNEILQIKLTNLAGSLAFKSVVNSNEAFETRNMLPGIYVYEVTGESGTIKGTIVVQP